MYRKQILEHFRNPRNVGKIENADGFGEAGGGPRCPEGLTCFWIRVADGSIAEVKHETVACPVVIVARSATSVEAQGKPLRENRRGGPGKGRNDG